MARETLPSEMDTLFRAPDRFSTGRLRRDPLVTSPLDGIDLSEREQEKGSSFDVVLGTTEFELHSEFLSADLLSGEAINLLGEDTTTDSYISSQNESMETYSGDSEDQDGAESE